MLIPPLPPDEVARLTALRATGLLDTDPEERFDRITRTVARLFGVPIVLVSLVDECRQWFKSRIGLEATETPRDISFCGHAILEDKVLVVEDARADPRFSDNPLVTGPPYIRFYAGCPLSGPRGELLGTLCLISPEPRIFVAADVAALQDVAAWAGREVNQAMYQDALAAAREGERFFNYSPDLFHLASFEGRFLKVNPAYTHTLGWREAELLATPIKDLIHPDDRGSAREGTERLAHGETILKFKHRLRHKDGSFRWIAWKGFAEGDQIYGFGQDVTALVEAENALKESEARYRALVEDSIDLISEVDASGRFLSVSKALERDMGYGSDELNGRFCTEIVDPEDRPGLARFFKQLLAGVEGESFSFRAFHKDGRLLWHESKGRRVRGPRGGEAIITMRNVDARIRDQEALARSEVRYHALVEGMAEGMILRGPGGVVHACNPAAARMLGLPLEQILGHGYRDPFAAYLHEDGSPMAPEDVPSARALREGRPIRDVVMGFLRRDGSQVWNIVTAIPLRHPEGHQVVVTFADITALREMQAEHRLMLEMTTDIIAVHDLEGGYRYVTPSLEVVTGYTPEEALGHVPHDFTHPQDRAQLINLHRQLLRGERPGSLRYRATAKDGRELWLESSGIAVRDASGKIIEIVYTSRDVTARQEMENSLSLSEARFRGMLSAIPDEMFRVRKDGTYLDVHASLPGALWHPPDYFIGRTLHQILPKDVADARLAAIGRALETREVQVIQYRLAKDGKITDFEARTMPSGESETITIVRNITHQKAEERLKQEFVSMVSHELRTPLTSIRGSLGLLDAKVLGDLPPKVGELVSIAKDNAERLVRLVNDILDLDKVENGKMSFNLQSCELGISVLHAVESVHGFATSMGTGVMVESLPPEAWVMADADRINQVLVNLLANAIKYSPKGTPVLLRIKPNGPQWRVEVEDHGPGIPEAFQTSIFQKFAQAEPLDTRQKGGTGLGLSIARALVEGMGASIRFTSAPGSTIFQVDFPEAQPLVLGVEPAKPLVLVVEDDPLSARLLEAALTKEGFRVHRAATAAEAKVLLDQNRYHAMTLDLLLPDQHGLKLLEELRQRPDTQDLPVLVASSAAREGPEHAGRPGLARAGMDAETPGSLSGGSGPGPP